MHKFVRNLITEWRRLGLPFKDAAVIVAVSGGSDSTALLLALADLRKRKKLDLDIITAHFNHKLRGKESKRDKRFVRDLAETLGFEFVSESGLLEGKSNLEQRARDERYAFLLKIAKKKKAHIVLTAHTMDDQAETVLMNLIRGSGVDGLSGMKAVRELGNRGAEETGKSEIQLVRPLLSWARRIDTEEFCSERDVKPRHDAMNDDLRFTRVRIRKTILPLLAEINPKIVESLARTGELLGQERVQIEPNNNETMSISDLEKYGNTELNSHIRMWIRQNRGTLRGLELKHIEAVGRLIKSRKSGRVVELPGGDQAVKSGGRLAFRHIKLEN
jgi:tRNA(Ile)-lysidine synthase